MDNPRPEKVAVVAEVRERLDGAEAVVLTEYRGLNVADMAALRKALREAGGEYKIFKNSMVRFAAADLDLDIEELLVGPTALAFTGTRPDGSAGDPVSVAKALADFGRTNHHLVIKGGLLEGRPLAHDEVMALSRIAPREELLARLAGGMAAPMQQFAALLNAVLARFGYGLQALIEAGGGPGASAPTEDAAPAEEAGAEDAAAEDAAPAEDAAAEDAAPAEDAAAEDAAPAEEATAADAAAETEDATLAEGATEAAPGADEDSESSAAEAAASDDARADDTDEEGES